MKGFLQGESYSPVGFCQTEVPISMLIKVSDGYTMGQRDKERVKRTHSILTTKKPIKRITENSKL